MRRRGAKCGGAKEGALEETLTRLHPRLLQALHVKMK